MSLNVNFRKIDESDKIIHGNGNKTTGANLTIHGNDNLISGNGCTVFGDHNVIKGSDAFVSGDHNVVEGGNCTVYGYANKVKPGLGSRYVSTAKYSDTEAYAVSGRESTVTFNPEAWDEEAGRSRARAPVVLSSAPPPLPPLAKEGTNIEGVRNLKYTSEKLPDGAAACVICIEREPDVVAMPCMHKRYCGVCVMKMHEEKTQFNYTTKKMKCSLCQQDVDEFRKVY